MYTLGIPKRDYRRATQVLGYESAEEIPYNATLQDDGFYIFTFPEVGDEYSFRKIANRLKSEGIRIIGADAQLTEKKIMKLASLINLEPLEEMDINDPALMRARAAKTKMDQMKSNPRIGFDQVLDLRGEKRDLELQINNIYREMENDPDIEPEGGPVADEYGDTLNRLETRLYKINKQIASYDMSEGEDEDDEQDMADVKADIASMNETTEKAWNAVDVSRTAEKAISNKEWNERTGKKLDMLKALNKAGKFKKKGGWDEEELQGWVDKNYSWTQVSNKFQLNEIYSLMYKNTPTVFNNPIFENYTKQSLLKALGSADDALIQTHVSPGEKGEGDYRLDGQEYVIYNPNSNNDDNAAMWNSDDYVVALDKDGEEYEIAYADIMRINMDEGSCGYGPDGVPGNTPGETKGMPADDRTRGMLKKLIQREIAKYENK